jgi:hypothetical protein
MRKTGPPRETTPAWCDIVGTTADDLDAILYHNTAPAAIQIAAYRHAIITARNRLRALVCQELGRDPWEDQPHTYEV